MFRPHRAMTNRLQWWQPGRVKHHGSRTCVTKAYQRIFSHIHLTDAPQHQGINRQPQFGDVALRQEEFDALFRRKSTFGPCRSARANGAEGATHLVLAQACQLRFQSN